MRWERSGLEAEGFLGFIPFAKLPTAGVPVGAGVYVIYRDSDEPPRLLERSSGGHFKRKDPTVPMAVLASTWVTGARVLNIGKAAVGSSGRRGLFKRLNEYRRFGAGEPIGHWGGRYIWQMSDSPALLSPRRREGVHRRVRQALRPARVCQPRRLRTCRGSVRICWW